MLPRTGIDFAFKIFEPGPISQGGLLVVLLDEKSKKFPWQSYLTRGGNLSSPGFGFWGRKILIAGRSDSGPGIGGAWDMAGGLIGA